MTIVVTSKWAQCGKQKYESRIVGGVEAIPHSWPWQCSLQMSGDYINIPMCGCSIVNHQWVITAAHCM